MSLGSWSPTRFWLFARIQSLRLSGLDQLPNRTRFPQSWGGRDGVWWVVREIREGERWGLGTGWPGVGGGARRRGSSESAGVGASSLPRFQQHDFREATALLHSPPREGCCHRVLGRVLAEHPQEEAFDFPSSLPGFLSLTAPRSKTHCLPRLGRSTT